MKVVFHPLRTSCSSPFPQPSCTADCRATRVTMTVLRPPCPHPRPLRLHHNAPGSDVIHARARWRQVATSDERERLRDWRGRSCRRQPASAVIPPRSRARALCVPTMRGLAGAIQRHYAAGDQARRQIRRHARLRRLPPSPAASAPNGLAELAKLTAPALCRPVSRTTSLRRYSRTIGLVTSNGRCNMPGPRAQRRRLRRAHRPQPLADDHATPTF